MSDPRGLTSSCFDGDDARRSIEGDMRFNPNRLCGQARGDSSFSDLEDTQTYVNATRL